MLFDDQDDLANRIDDEMLDKLVELSSARAEYLQAAAQVQNMRAEQFKGSFRFDQAELDSYVEQVLAPRRTKVYRLQSEMLVDAVDVDQIKSLLPMVLAGLISKVDLELVFSIIGVDIDAAKEGMKLIQEFINQ